MSVPFGSQAKAGGSTTPINNRNTTSTNGRRHQPTTDDKITADDKTGGSGPMHEATDNGAGSSSAGHIIAAPPDTNGKQSMQQTERSRHHKTNSSNGGFDLTLSFDDEQGRPPNQQTIDNRPSNISELQVKYGQRGRTIQRLQQFIINHNIKFNDVQLKSDGLEQLLSTVQAEKAGLERKCGEDKELIAVLINENEQLRRRSVSSVQWFSMQLDTTISNSTNTKSINHNTTNNRSPLKRQRGPADVSDGEPAPKRLVMSEPGLEEGDLVEEGGLEEGDLLGASNDRNRNNNSISNDAPPSPQQLSDPRSGAARADATWNNITGHGHQDGGDTTTDSKSSQNTISGLQKKMAKELLARGQKLVRVPGDNHCLFHSINHQLYGHILKKSEVKGTREAIGDFIKNSMDFDSIDRNYFNDLRNKSAHAGQHVLVAYTEKEGVLITVHQLNQQGKLVVGEPYRPRDGRNNGHIFLSLVQTDRNSDTSGHWDSIIFVKNPINRLNKPMKLRSPIIDRPPFLPPIEPKKSVPKNYFEVEQILAWGKYTQVVPGDLYPIEEEAFYVKFKGFVTPKWVTKRHTQCHRFIMRFEAQKRCDMRMGKAVKSEPVDDPAAHIIHLAPEGEEEWDMFMAKREASADSQSMPLPQENYDACPLMNHLSVSASTSKDDCASKSTESSVNLSKSAKRKERQCRFMERKSFVQGSSFKSSKTADGDDELPKSAKRRQKMKLAVEKKKLSSQENETEL